MEGEGRKVKEGIERQEGATVGDGVGTKYGKHETLFTTIGVLSHQEYEREGRRRKAMKEGRQ